MSLSFKTCTAILAIMAGTGLAVPSRTCPSTNTTCQEPPNQTTGYPDYDLFCKCNATIETAWGNPYLGLVRCDTTCTPAKAEQRVAHNDKADLLSTCMNACTGSFEKAKRQGNDDYWFCHGVNFRKGELCEFIGSLGEKTFQAGSGTDCYYIDGLDG
ncbi:hypothetical protein F4824DRAFT_453694 [Ustulina deusta]|nr:hypothetical protein F4823DRAFT_617489 [Ustulina deusta]KAI3339966.1 hypothetical protein F4824DRAFT_453694 [Ustulina deusta]